MSLSETFRQLMSQNIWFYWIVDWQGNKHLAGFTQDVELAGDLACQPDYEVKGYYVS